MKIGILGGTFDPVHLGHLAIAEEARAKLKLDEVIFVPAGQPWMKKDTPVSPAEHRINMLRLAISGKTYFKLSTVEIERGGLSYSVETVAELRAKLKAEDEIVLIVGWDSLETLPQWREPARLITMCRIVALPRPGYKRPDIASLEKEVPGLSERVILLDKPEIAISATEIRERVRQGLPISHLVPEAIERYIREKGLYL